MCRAVLPERGSLPPHLIVDFGVGRDRVVTGDQCIGETDEPFLLGSITRSVIRSVEGHFVEPDKLFLPVEQGELKALTTSPFAGS